jgi:putative ABC transport system permease protein
LALGIGINTAIFTVVDAVLLKPLTYPDADRMVQFQNVSPEGKGNGASALVLASIGIYGLMAYSVQQRTQEMGIRMALGADRKKIRNLVVWQGMQLAIAGVFLGVCASFGLTRLIASFLFGVKSWDPVVFVTVPPVLAAVALLTVWLPATRASRLDPMAALRVE